MKGTFILAFLALAQAPTVSAAQDASGLWRTEATDQGHLEVRIVPCGAALCGKIVRAVDTAGQSAPYPHTGRQMIWDMQPDGNGVWSGGKIWDPRNDRTFNSKMALTGRALTVSGCFLGICQSQVWRAVD